MEGAFLYLMMIVGLLFFRGKCAFSLKPMLQNEAHQVPR
jgi:hypothetical protein